MHQRLPVFLYKHDESMAIESHFEILKSEDQLVEKIKDDIPCVVVTSETKLITKIEALKNEGYSHVNLILSMYGASKDRLIENWNHEVTYSIVDEETTSSEVLSIIEDAQNDIYSYIQKNNILQKVRTQNKTLQELNENLEEIVEQRTDHIQSSNDKIQIENRSLKQLNKFIKSLSYVEAIEDILLILRQDTKSYHNVRSPIFVYSIDEIEYRCLYFQGSQLIDTTFSGAFNRGVMSKDELLRETLVEELQRPIGTIKSIPIDNLYSKAVVIFEHALKPEEEEEFQTFMSKRLDLLRFSFDQVALKMRYRQLSYQWTRTFDTLEDPIAILDKDFNILRDNLSFREKVLPQIPSSGDGVASYFSENNDKLSLGGCVYEVNRHKIPSPTMNTENFLIQLVDVTRAMDLQIQLVQSEKVSALGLLAGNIAHELNNPLTGIKSLSQMMAGDPDLDSQLSSDFKEVFYAAERCEKIIKNLLEFSSFEKNSAEVISIFEVIQKTLPFLKGVTRYQNFSVNVEDHSKLVKVQSHLLQQVIFNIVNNACQAMGDEGDLVISSSFDNENVYLSIADTGPGIPISIQEKIFLPFFTTKKEGVGTGIGLSMGRSIVEKFGGELKLIKSNQDGTEFCLVLPLCNKSS